MKKYFKILFLFFIILFSINVNAIETYKDGISRKELKDYGVNKHWNINDSNMNNVLSTPKVDASLKVYDYGEILSEDDEKAIKKYISEYIEHTNMDMAFVTVNMPYSNDKVNEDYAADFYDYNDFGLDLEKYSGVLLLRNTYEKDPYFNIYLFGNAQLYYVGDRADNMLRDITPYFTSNQYVEGFRIFKEDFINYYDDGAYLTDYVINDDGYLIKDKGSFRIPYIICIIVGIVADLIVLPIMVKKNKMINVAKKADVYMDRTTINYKTKTDKFLTTNTVSHRISSSTSSGSGGFSSSSGSSGGGHSSGGGVHG